MAERIEVDEVIRKYKLNKELAAVVRKFNLFGEGEGNKPFRKNLRFGVPVIEAFSLMGGKGFNEIFENICTDYVKTLPEREKRIRDLDQQIKSKEEYLNKLREAINNMEGLERSFNSLKTTVKNIDTAASSFINKYSSNSSADTNNQNETDSTDPEDDYDLNEYYPEDDDMNF